MMCQLHGVKGCTICPPIWRFAVYGRPAPQGSKVHVGRGILVEASMHVRPWREAVRETCWQAKPPGAPPLDGPLVARMVFTVAKPLGAPRRRRTWPAVAPDLSKLLRSTEDALTDAGVWVNDGRVVEYSRLAKVYPGEDGEALLSPGVRIAVYRVSDEVLLPYSREDPNAISAAH